MSYISLASQQSLDNDSDSAMIIISRNYNKSFQRKIRSLLMTSKLTHEGGILSYIIQFSGLILVPGREMPCFFLYWTTNTERFRFALHFMVRCTLFLLPRVFSLADANGSFLNVFKNNFKLIIDHTM